MRKRKERTAAQTVFNKSYSPYPSQGKRGVPDMNVTQRHVELKGDGYKRWCFLVQFMIANTKACTHVCVKAVVSQQGNKVDDLVDVFFIVGFVRYKDLPCFGNTN